MLSRDDAAKLRMIADWYDWYDEQTNFHSSNQVQVDLRRMAEDIDNLFPPPSEKKDLTNAPTLL